MGFDLSTICPTFTNTAENTINGLGVIGQCPNWNNSLQDGKNITGGFIGLDGVINKKTNFNQVPTGAFDDTSTDQFKIVATTPTTQTQLDSGYFLIEINSNFNNEFTDETNTYKKISAIVSRYYSQGSYTSSDISASIPYIHRGQTVSLNNFNVRILDKNKNLVDNSGDDNCVFIELIKNNNNNDNK